MIERVTGSVRTKRGVGRQYVEFIGAIQKDFGCIVIHCLGKWLLQDCYFMLKFSIYEMNEFVKQNKVNLLQVH